MGKECLNLEAGTRIFLLDIRKHLHWEGYFALIIIGPKFFLCYCQRAAFHTNSALQYWIEAASWIIQPIIMAYHQNNIFLGTFSFSRKSYIPWTISWNFCDIIINEIFFYMTNGKSDITTGQIYWILNIITSHAMLN